MKLKKFLQKEYKANNRKGVTLTKAGEPKILVQTTSRIRTFVQAYQHYKISGIKDMDSLLEPSRDTENAVIKKFLAQGHGKKTSKL